MTNNETFSNEMTFGFEPRAKVNVPSHVEARVRLPSPPTPDLAEQHALTEFQRLRLAKSSNSEPRKSPNERQEKSSNKSPNGGTVFASVNNSAETVIQRKLSERWESVLNYKFTLNIKMQMSKASVCLKVSNDFWERKYPSTLCVKNWPRRRDSSDGRAGEQQYHSFTLRLPRWTGLSKRTTEPVWVQVL